MTYDIPGKVAVITGGASGMGKAMALRFGTAGAKVVVADIEEPAIDSTVAQLGDSGIAAIGVVTNVSDEAAVLALRDTTLERFGRADVVCLNAGVGAGGPMASLTKADWAWVLDVNLWGVINGLTAFLPGLQAQDDGHIVITASVAGILSYPGMGPYNASKHAVLSIAESLHHELVAANSGVGVSALCPGLVNTNILDSERNRPEHYQKSALDEPQPDREQMRAIAKEIYSQALSPEAVAEMVQDAVEQRQFYIMTDGVFDDAIARRHREVESRSNPSMEAHLLEEHLSRSSDRP